VNNLFQYTIFFQLLTIINKKANNLKAIVLGSRIIQGIIAIIDMIQVSANESKFIQVFLKAKIKSAKWFSGSKLLSRTFKKDNSYFEYKESKFYLILDKTLNFPVSIAKWIASNLENVLNGSKFVEILKFTLKKFEIILSVAILIILLVPDTSWYNIYLLGIMLVIFLLYFLRVSLLGYEGFDVRGISVYFWVFFFSIILAIVTSYDIHLSSRFAAFNIVNILLIIILVSAIKTSSSLKNLVFVYVFGVFLTAAYGVWQAATGSIPFNPSFTDVAMNQGMPGRIYSTMGNANNYAEILIMTVPYIIALFQAGKTNGKKWFVAFMAAIILIALVYTGSRSSWLAFLAGVGIITFFKKKSLLPVFLILGIVSIPFLPDFLWRRFITIFQASSDSSTQYRLKILKTVIPIMKDYWFSGIGLGTDVFMKIADRSYYQYTLNTPLHTHILYTQILLEMGILGAGSFILGIFKTLKNLFNNIKSQTDLFLKNIFIASFASIAGILLVGFLEYPWYYPRVMFFFWFNIGIALVALNIVNRQKIVQVK
jgi:putative inorganic carbon (HCO3(-)) transporter